MAINLSIKQFKQADLLEQIDQVLAKTGVSGENLNLEITETVLMDQVDDAKQILQQLKQRQVQLSIDDFGTGYSSLSYLHRFPIDVLKIDRSFVQCLGYQEEELKTAPQLSLACQRRDELAIVETILLLGHKLGMATTAEGIETKAQWEHLKQLGCDRGQGYYFSKPQPGDKITQWMEQYNNRNNFG
jgi:EAL domain-containing protein (putative c-di-GMP-specific phosphodiesterase class I)